MPVCVVVDLPQFQEWQEAKERLKAAKKVFGVASDIARLEIEVQEKQDRWNVIEELLGVGQVEVIPNPEQHEEYRDLNLSQYHLYEALRAGTDSNVLEKEVQLFLELWRTKEAFLQAKAAVHHYKASLPRYILPGGSDERKNRAHQGPTGVAEETPPVQRPNCNATEPKRLQEGGLFGCPPEKSEEPSVVVTGSKFFQVKRPRPW